MTTPQELLNSVVDSELAKRGVPRTPQTINMMKEHLLSNSDPRLMRMAAEDMGGSGEQRTAGRTVSGVQIPMKSSQMMPSDYPRAPDNLEAMQAAKASPSIDDVIARGEAPPQPTPAGDDEAGETVSDNEGAEGEAPDLADHTVETIDGKPPGPDLLSLLGLGATVGGVVGGTIAAKRRGKGGGADALEGEIVPMDEAAVEDALVRGDPRLAGPANIPVNRRLAPPREVPIDEAPPSSATPEVLPMPDQRANQRMNLNETTRDILGKLDTEEAISNERGSITKNKPRDSKFVEYGGTEGGPVAVVRDATGKVKYNIMPDGSIKTSAGKAITAVQRRAVLKLMRMHL